MDTPTHPRREQAVRGMDRLWRRSRRKLVSPCPDRRLHPTLNADLPGDRAHMSLHRGARDQQPLGTYPLASAAHKLTEDGLLSRRHRGEGACHVRRNEKAQVDIIEMTSIRPPVLLRSVIVGTAFLAGDRPLGQSPVATLIGLEPRRCDTGSIGADLRGLDAHRLYDVKQNLAQNHF